MSVLVNVPAPQIIEIIATEPSKVIELIALKGKDGLGADSYIFDEIPAGVINGSNATFTTAFDFVPESVAVNIGVRLKGIEDYQTVGNRTIILNQSPMAGENISIDYIKL